MRETMSQMTRNAVISSHTIVEACISDSISIIKGSPCPTMYTHTHYSIAINNSGETLVVEKLQMAVFFKGHLRCKYA